MNSQTLVISLRAVVFCWNSSHSTSPLPNEGFLQGGAGEEFSVLTIQKIFLSNEGISLLHTTQTTLRDNPTKNPPMSSVAGCPPALLREAVKKKSFLGISLPNVGGSGG